MGMLSHTSCLHSTFNPESHLDSPVQFGKG